MSEHMYLDHYVGLRHKRVETAGYNFRRRILVDLNLGVGVVNWHICEGSLRVLSGNIGRSCGGEGCRGGGGIGGGIGGGGGGTRGG